MPQLEKGLMQQQRPNAAKRKKSREIATLIFHSSCLFVLLKLETVISGLAFGSSEGPILKGRVLGLPCGPVVKNPPSNAGTQVRSLVGELRSHILWGN